jgi:hypothetical protein
MSVPFQEKVIGERLYQVINRGVVGTPSRIYEYPCKQIQ